MNFKVIKKDDELQIFSNGSQLKTDEVDIVWNDMKFESPKNPQKLPQNRLLDIIEADDVDDEESIIELILITSNGEILTNENLQTIVIPRLFINGIEKKINNITWFIDGNKVNTDSLLLTVNRSDEWEEKINYDGDDDERRNRIFDNDGVMVEISGIITLNNNEYSSSILIQRVDNYNDDGIDDGRTGRRDDGDDDDSDRTGRRRDDRNDDEDDDEQRRDDIIDSVRREGRQ